MRKQVFVDSRLPFASSLSTTTIVFSALLQVRCECISRGFCITKISFRKTCEMAKEIKNSSQFSSKRVLKRGEGSQKKVPPIN